MTLRQLTAKEYGALVIVGITLATLEAMITWLKANSRKKTPILLIGKNFKRFIKKHF